MRFHYQRHGDEDTNLRDVAITEGAEFERHYKEDDGTIRIYNYKVGPLTQMPIHAGDQKDRNGGTQLVQFEAICTEDMASRFAFKRVWVNPNGLITNLPTGTLSDSDEGDWDFMVQPRH